MNTDQLAQWFEPADMSVDERAEFIERAQWLNNPQWQQLTLLAEHTTLYDVPAGDMIFKEGEAGDFMALIICGQIELQKRDEHEDIKVLYSLGKGKTLGEMALIDGEPRSATAIAVSKVQLLVMTAQDLAELEDQHPRLWGHFILRLARLISGRLRRTSGELVDHR